MINTQNSAQGINLRTVSELNAKTAGKGLGQEAFLKLMTTQLQNQDPTKPMDNNNFLAQLAQFSTVRGISDLNKNFDSLSKSLVSNQALQAANLVGHQVLASTGVAPLHSGGNIHGKVDLPSASSNVVVNIYDQAGQVVRKLELGAQPSGLVDFKWDGLKNDGKFADPGSYFISAEAGINGKFESVNTLLASEVNSVTLSNSGGLLLNLDGVGPPDFKEVRQIL